MYYLLIKHMAPRQIVHILLILSEAIIIACCLIMIIKYDRTGSNEKIWIGSKILTLEKEMKKNNYELHPLLGISSDGELIEYYQNYESLLYHSNPNCEENYKKCGILDTYGNTMCIPNGDECPINEIIIDEESKYNYYLSQGYQKANLEKLTEGYAIYYTNIKVNQEIIVKIKFSDEIPRYINEENFVFDEKVYKSFQSSTDYGDRDYDYDGGGGGGGGGFDGFDVGSGGGGFRNLEEEEEYGDEEMTKYIKNKFAEDVNIDKTYKNIFNNLYVGNYLGFANIYNLKDYNNADLYDLYFTVFPNGASYILCYFCIIALIVMIIISIVRFCHEDVPNEGFDPCCVLTVKLIIIIPYLAIFIGYFVYMLCKYFNLYKERNPENLLKILADEFIKDLLSDINDRHLKEVFIFSMIILFSCAMFFFILAWILSYIFTKRYLKLLKNAGRNVQNIL